MEMSKVLLIVISFLVASGCGPSTITLVHPRSGEQVVCPFKPGQAPASGPLTAEKAGELGRLMAETNLGRITPLEFCIKQYELVGYVRSPMGPGNETVEQSYTNSTYRWSISYPRNWTVDDKDPSFVKIISAANNALCGVHSGAVRFKTVDEYTDFMQAYSERSFRDKGVMVRSGPRQKISLPNNVIGNDVLTEILSGGRSRRIYVLVDAREFAIDCETYAKDWGKLEPSFDRIINSFAVGK
jgi:hypothetical protein